jgi:YHS domain-containing protein
VAVALSLSTTLVAAQALNTDKSGVAVSGYDPVAYFSQTTALKGSAQITATHGGATYYFSSTANRDTFLANPDKYAPVYGGYCAYGVAKGHKVSIDPEAFRVVDGKLYLNHDKSVQEKWLADIPGNIAQAKLATAPAVYRPTPGRSINCSGSAGTVPACSATTVRASRCRLAARR